LERNEEQDNRFAFQYSKNQGYVSFTLFKHDRLGTAINQTKAFGNLLKMFVGFANFISL